MARMTSWAALATAAVVLGLAGSGCTQVVVRAPEPQMASRGHGPPPHAPAHGYRAKTRGGTDLVFDTGLGVYVVVDLPSVFYLDDLYYRRGSEGRWERCDRLDGAWIVITESALPPGLRAKKSAADPKPPGKSRGHGPASRGSY